MRILTMEQYYCIGLCAAHYEKRLWAHCLLRLVFTNERETIYRLLLSFFAITQHHMCSVSVCVKTCEQTSHNGQMNLLCSAQLIVLEAMLISVARSRRYDPARLPSAIQSALATLLSVTWPMSTMALQ